MGRPWHKADPENLARLEANIAEAFPDLKVVEEGECLFVRGYFPIAEGETVLDRFHIEVALPRNGPKGIFTVRELDGRIPRTPDRHVNDDRSRPVAGGC